MVPMPVILLYVYDKNNGVLEHLLSIGWNQNDIFKQYLKAALFLAVTVFVGESVVVLYRVCHRRVTGSISVGRFDAAAHSVPRFLRGLLYYHGDDGL